MAVEVGGAIVPPDGSAFAEPDLGLVDSGSGFGKSDRVGGFEGSADGASCIHQGIDKRLPLRIAEAGIGAPPKPAPNHDVTAIGRHGWFAPC